MRNVYKINQNWFLETVWILYMKMGKLKPVKESKENKNKIKDIVNLSVWINLIEVNHTCLGM